MRATFRALVNLEMMLHYSIDNICDSDILNVVVPEIRHDLCRPVFLRIPKSLDQG